jgi:hypothetical protein
MNITRPDRSVAPKHNLVIVQVKTRDEDSSTEDTSMETKTYPSYAGSADDASSITMKHITLCDQLVQL